MPETLIPEDPQAAIDAPTPKSYEVVNFADPKQNPRQHVKLVEEVKKRLIQCDRDFRGQNARSKMLSRIKRADQMFRMTASQTKQDNNRTNGDTDHRPEIFYSVLRTITANENYVLYRRMSPPAKFLPLSETDDATKQDAWHTCNKRNALLAYSNEADDRLAKFEDTQWATNKYGNSVVTMEWKARKGTKRDRVPTQVDSETGAVTAAEWVNKPYDESHPTMIRYPIEDVLFDATIDDAQQQQAIIFSWRPTYGELVAGEQAGDYANVKDVGKAQLWQGEQNESTKADRQENADEGSDQGVENGLLDCRHAWMWIPVTAKGKWDAKATVPSWHLVSFAGRPEGDMVPLRIIANPHRAYNSWDDEIPVVIYHSLWDDKGAYHVGLADLIESAWDDYKTSLDQWYDAKDMATAAPILMEEGAMITDDKDFGPRKLKVMTPGMIDRIKRFPYQIYTADMQAFLGFVIERIRDIAGVNKAVAGQEMGSRTSASEYRGAWDQAMRPMLDKMQYNQNQLLRFVAKWDSALWRQYAEPTRTVGITRETEIQTVKPAALCGEYVITIAAVEEYENDTIRRLEDDKLLQIGLPVLAQTMKSRRLLAFLRGVFEKRNFDPAMLDVAFSTESQTDARNVARAENQGFIDHVPDVPEMGEDDEIHLDEHTNFKALLQSFGPEADPVALQMTEQHIVATKAQMSQQGAALAGQQQAQAAQQEAPGQTPEAPTGLPSAEAPAMTAGAVAQNLLGAEGGAANV